jgi:hypothetical protein
MLQFFFASPAGRNHPDRASEGKRERERVCVVSDREGGGGVLARPERGRGRERGERERGAVKLQLKVC